MSAKKTTRFQPEKNGYTYPEFVIDESSGQVAVNLVDTLSGKVVRHIPPTELNQITRGTAPSTDAAGASQA